MSKKPTVTIKSGDSEATVPLGTFSKIAERIKGEPIIAEACDTIGKLIAGRYKDIRDLADEEDAKGQVRVSIGLVLDFNGKTPAGAVAMSFAKRVKDEATFRVEDPDQTKLGLEEE